MQTCKEGGVAFCAAQVKVCVFAWAILGKLDWLFLDRSFRLR